MYRKKSFFGGDCDINLTLLDEGWGVGYFPQLKLTHLIPAGRLTKDYLARLNRGISCSWVQVLDMHEIRPWSKISQWTVFPRKVRAFFNYQPWKIQSPIFAGKVLVECLKDERNYFKES